MKYIHEIPESSDAIDVYGSLLCNGQGLLFFQDVSLVRNKIGTTTINTTIPNVFNVTAQWSQNTGDEIVTQIAILE